MSLPANQDLLKLFGAFLAEAGLSSISIKNYVSDLRHFLAFCTHLSNTENEVTPELIFQSLSKYINLYSENQKSNFTPTNTINRRSASIRRFSTFLKTSFNIQEAAIEQNASASNTNATSTPKTSSYNFSSTSTDDQYKKVISQFKQYLEKEKKTHSTVKNYLSDINHFINWSANETPFTTQNLENLVSLQQVNAYSTYEKLSHTSTSVINRRLSTIKKFAQFAFSNNYLPSNPFEKKMSTVRLAPLAWLERLSTKNNDKLVIKNNPVFSKFKTVYQKYNSFRFTPYIHLAILVLATSAMAIFAYDQIIKSAFPSLAATPPVVPNRQLSFQGRLTDTSSNPITSSVNVNFRLYDALTSGTLLYDSSACPVSPDQNGIFNTLIGNGTCGAAIPATVFSNNRDVFVEIQVAAETLTPRQQIATVGYALNSDTLQGYPASASATINTVPVMDNNGNIVLAQLNPSIVATTSSGTFSIRGETLSLQTTAGSGGNIIIQPDTAGAGNIQLLPSAATGNQVRIQDANLTTGTLISGYSGNTNDAPGLLVLSSGSSESEKFAVRADGQTRITTDNTLANAALMINQVGTGDILAASSSGASKFVIKNDGKVGIGITNPSYALSVVGQVNGSTGLCINGDCKTSWSEFNYWQWNAGVLSPLSISDSINLGDPATSSATVHLAGKSGDSSFINTGNVGIGITNPGYGLEVNGTARINGNFTIGDNSADTVTSNSGAWTFVNATTVALNNSVNSLNFDSNTLTIDASNNRVGVGMTNPGQALDVSGNATVSGVLTSGGQIQVGRYATAPTSLGGGSIYFDTGTNKLYYYNGSSWVDTTGGTGSGTNFWQWNSGVISPVSLTDAINLGATATNSATVHLAGVAGDNSFINTGNFGIGLTNPAAKLDVDGSVNITGYATASASIAVGYTNVLAGAGNAAFSGNVGVGITSPSASINIRAGTATAGSAPLKFTSGTNLATPEAGAMEWDGTRLYITQTTGPTRQSIAYISDITATNYWQRNLGVLSPVYITDDLAIGGTSTASASFQVFANTGNATSSGNLTLGYNKDIRSAYGPLTLSYKSGANSWGSAVTVQDTTGYVGIDNTTPGANLDVTGTGRFSSTLTASNGLTLTTGALNLTSTSGALSLSGLSASSINTGTNTLTITSGTGASTFNTTATGINATQIGATTAASGAFTTLTSTGVTTLGNDSATVAINSSDWDITTGGDMTGIGALTMDGNFSQTGATTFGTGTGAISLNGDTTIAANKDLSLASGTGVYSQIFTGTDTTAATITANSLTSGGALDINTSATGLTGDLVKFESTGSNAGITGNALKVGITGATGTGTALNVTNAGTGVSFRVNDDGTYTDTSPFIIDNAGNVGMGLTSPTTKLDVNGSVNITGYATASASIAVGYTNVLAGKGNAAFYGRVGIGLTNPSDTLQVAGNILPGSDNNKDLGNGSLGWQDLYLTKAIRDINGTSTIDIANKYLSNGNWALDSLNSTFVVGQGYAGAITLDSSTGTNNGTVTIGASGDGKINVGTVDPPFTINGEKYSTYLPGMVGIKEEVTGNIATTDYVDGVGYRTVLDLAHQPKDSDLWVFSKTTDIERNIDDLAILLTAQSQARTWYELDKENKILAIYSSAPTTISYRMTGSRFDKEKWATKTPERSVTGLIVNIPDSPINPNGTILPNYTAEITKAADGIYSIASNGKQNLEQGSFLQLLAANFKAGIAIVTEVVANNVTVKEKIISPLAEINTLNTNQLTSKEATISGTLYAENIQSTTISNLDNKLATIGNQYSTASAILAELQAKYSTYDSLMNPQASSSSDLLNYVSLITPTASIPGDIALNSIQVATINVNDLQINNSLIVNSLNSQNDDLYIQPQANKPVHLLAELMVLHPNGQVIINGDLLISGTLYANAIDTKSATISGQLNIGTNTASTSGDKLIAVYSDNGNLISSVDASGSADFQQVATNELIIAAGNDSSEATSSSSTSSNATIGTATVSANQTEVFIQNNKIDGNTLVYLTPVSDTQNQVLFVKSKETNIGFTVGINSPASQEIKFNYWLVKTK